jgi:chromosome segregation ATPase
VVPFFIYKNIKEGLNVGEIDVLEIRIENLEAAVKELREESKEDRKLFAAALNGLNESLHDLKENGVKLNMLLERSNEKLGYLNNKVEAIEKDIKTIPPQEVMETEQQWYRNVISNGAKYLFYILILLLCVSLGLKIEDVFGILK